VRIVQDVKKSVRAAPELPINADSLRKAFATRDLDSSKRMSEVTAGTEKCSTAKALTWDR